MAKVFPIGKNGTLTAKQWMMLITLVRRDGKDLQGKSLFEAFKWFEQHGHPLAYHNLAAEACAAAGIRLKEAAHAAS
jgi:hypothetical protein